MDVPRQSGRWGGTQHSACDEEPDDLHGWEAWRQYGARRAEMCAGREDIVDDWDERGSRSRQAPVDWVPGLDLRRRGSSQTVMGGIRAVRLNDDFAHVGRPVGPNGAEHPRNPIVMERIVARFGRWHSARTTSAVDAGPTLGETPWPPVESPSKKRPDRRGRREPLAPAGRGPWRLCAGFPLPHHHLRVHSVRSGLPEHPATPKARTAAHMTGSAA